MSKITTITIAFAGGGIIPGVVLGRENEIIVPPHEVIKVPEAYGNHLIRDRIAYDPAEKAAKEKEADALRKGRAARLAADAEAAQRIARLETKIAELEAEISAERTKSAELEKRLNDLPASGPAVAVAE